MKTLLRPTIKILILFLLCIFSCQREENIIAPGQEGVNIPISNLTTELMRNVATNDGSLDNIIDNASCIEIELPIVVIIDNIELTIDSTEDFEFIEVIYDEFDDDDDTLEIVFPITIILPDFTEIIINTFEELTTYVDDCPNENEIDDDIECVDFQYPLFFSIFDNTIDVIDMVTINSDQSLFNFIDNLGQDDVVSVVFPVSLVMSNDEIIEVNSVSTLENTIISSLDICDEDDDNDQNDDDIVDITFEELTFALTDCIWSVEELLQNNEALDFEGATIDFNLDGTVSVNQDGTVYSGNWTATVLASNIRLDIDIEGLNVFDNNWIIHEFNIDDTVEVELRLGIDKISLIQDCTIEDSEIINEFQQILFSCSWLGIPNENDNFNQYFIYFQEDQSIFVFDIDTGQTIIGDWLLSTTENDQIVLNIDLDNPLLEFSGEWVVLFVDEDTIVFEDGQNTLNLLRDECPESEVVDTLIAQDNWEISLYEENNVNNTSIFEEFVFKFNTNHSINALNSTTEEQTSGVLFLIGTDLLQIKFGNTATPLHILNDNNSDDTWQIINFNSSSIELSRSNGSGIDRLIFTLQ